MRVREAKLTLPPRAVVLDLVLRWAETIGTAGTAKVIDGSLTFTTRNHQGGFVMLSTPVHFDGEPDEGDAGVPPRFVLRRLGPGVWKLAPSVLDERLHAYITLIDAPAAVEAEWSR